MTAENDFLDGLFDSLSSIRGYGVASILQQILRMDLFDDLGDSRTVEQLSAQRGFDATVLESVLDFLHVEGFVDRQEGPPATYRATAKATSVARYRGYFNLLVGGYGKIIGALDQMLDSGPGAVARDGEMVGAGSCQISQYDALPLAARLLRQVGGDTSSFVDIGCGDAGFLCDLCTQLPAARGIGVEPSTAAYQAGLELIEQRRLGDRVSLVNTDAQSLEGVARPDFFIFSFVLQEILGTDGEQGLVDYLKALAERYPSSRILAIEVDYRPHDLEVMRTEMGIGYYNLYYFLHPLTQQRLVSRQLWLQLFERSGYDVECEQVVDPRVDPTGLELGFVLRPQGCAT